MRIRQRLPKVKTELTFYFYSKIKTEMKKEIYLENNEDNYSKIISELVNAKSNFKLSQTNYTKTFKTETKTIILNDNGQKNQAMLNLISKVRKDTKNHIESTNFDTNKKIPIDWYFYNEVATDSLLFKGYKIDLNSAYWNIAQREKIITPETVNYFKMISENKSKKESKGIRLKALGSLATIKRVTTYENGIVKGNETVVNEANRSLYMYICSEVDRIMKSITLRLNLPYYYWDCLFVLPEQVDKVKDLLRVENIGFKVEESNFTVVKNSVFSFLLSESGNKSTNYPIRKTDIIN